MIALIEGYIQGQKLQTLGGVSNTFRRCLFRADIQATITIFPNTSEERAFQTEETVCN